MRLFFLMLAAAACQPALAQVYRCTEGGKTVLQQAPCAGAGAKIELRSTGPGAAETADLRSKAAALCEAALRTVPAWKDKESLLVTQVRRTGFTTINKHGTALAAVMYSARVNGKNSYGAYIGEKPGYCYLDPSETRVLDVLTP